LGLITTRGFEDTIFIGRGRQWADGLPESDVQNVGRVEKPLPLIPKRLVVGVKERVDYKGREVMQLSRDDVLDKVRYLVTTECVGCCGVCMVVYESSHERQIGKSLREYRSLSKTYL
jgi:N-methylhydantoinase A/acetophenone carboxylase